MKTLILGGVRSGKSRLAETLALRTNLPVTYIATATPGDDEMRARIDMHRANRPASWNVIEEPYALADLLQTPAPTKRCVIVDCLTLWLTNLLLVPESGLLERERKAFLAALPQVNNEIILVSNETNLGVIPADALSRRFCDEAGCLHQDLATICDRVVLTVAGLPMVIKGSPL